MGTNAINYQRTMAETRGLISANQRRLRNIFIFGITPLSRGGNDLVHEAPLR